MKHIIEFKLNENNDWKDSFRKQIIDAYLWIRKNNQSIPDDVLDFMKEAALEKLLGVNKIKGGDLMKYSVVSELIQFLKKFKSVAEKFQQDDSWVASAPNSSTFRASRSGVPVSFSFNDVHHGGYYAGSTPFLIQVRIGGGIDYDIRQALLDVAQSILSKFTYESEYGKSRLTDTSGTNWSSWMITAPRKGDSYNIIPKNYIEMLNK